MLKDTFIKGLSRPMIFWKRILQLLTARNWFLLESWVWNSCSLVTLYNDGLILNCKLSQPKPTGSELSFNSEINGAWMSLLVSLVFDFPATRNMHEVVSLLVPRRLHYITAVKNLHIYLVQYQVHSHLVSHHAIKIWFLDVILSLTEKMKRATSTSQL